jgi:hypothetical protein
LAETQLGRLVRHHDTNLRVRRVQAARVLLIGALWMTAAVVITVRFFATREVIYAAGPLLAGPGTVCLASGFAKLRRVIGIKQERIELYEQGLVVRLDDDQMVISWRDIGKVGRRGHRATPFERMAGVDFQYKLWLNSGRTLWFDSSTAHSDTLGDAVIAAVYRGEKPTPGTV